MIDQLLGGLAERLREQADDEEERELFDAALSLFTLGELLDVFTEETARKLKAHVARPAGLVLSLK